MVRQHEREPLDVVSLVEAIPAMQTAARAPLSARGPQQQNDQTRYHQDSIVARASWAPEIIALNRGAYAQLNTTLTRIAEKRQRQDN